jgi:hypothetical protein
VKKIGPIVDAVLSERLGVADAVKAIRDGVRALVA